MPLRQMPTFGSVASKRFQLAQPAVGGINLNDLEYEQNDNQSPYMLNMMYKNGAFSKRYGQELFFDTSFANNIYAMIQFNKKLIVHSGTKIYSVDIDTKVATEIQNATVSAQSGQFVIFQQVLYYLCNQSYYQYKYNISNSTWEWSNAEIYIPEHISNAEPGATENYDILEDLNLLSRQFNEIFNSDGSSTNYYLKGDKVREIIDWNATFVVKVDDVTKTLGTDYTVDKANKRIVFTTAPARMNYGVVITCTLKNDVMQTDRNRLLNCKYNATFGGNSGSCLFLAGGGDSKYFYSEALDATYFPEGNWAVIGNTEDDIKGFGLQYNILFIFKPREIYSINSYSSTITEDGVETEIDVFRAMLVNSRIGCDCPHTIQVINNLLTWFNSIEGVCTLVSTNIVDERNVRVISENINRTNNLGIKGIVDYTEDLETIQSVDFDNKYFLVFPTSGMCFMWDYEISPFSYTSSRVTDTKTLAWFLFDKFYVKQFAEIRNKLFYISSNSTYNKNLITLNDSFTDLDFNEDGEGDGINAYYMTPFLQFGAVEYLKNVKNIYVQCRGDTASVIDMSYYTNESIDPENEAEKIRIGGRLWTRFEWSNFQWLSVNYAKTFRRKCSLKKVEMCSFYFENKDKYNGSTLIESVAGRDMSISHISVEYQLVKTVK